VVWCVFGPGIHGKLQSLVCRCTVGQTTNVAEDGVTTSGYGAEYTLRKDLVRLTIFVWLSDLVDKFGCGN